MRPQLQPFPEFDRIAPVLSAIEGFGEFKVYHRPNGLTAVDYAYVGAETFGCLARDPPETHASIRLRREARGLKFDADGALIARPFEKFFNLGEKPEAEAQALPWSTPHVVLEKADGSMVHPFLLEGTLGWATRIGETRQSAMASAHAAASGLGYEALARDLIADGLTPIFEFTGPANRIVVAYAEPQLTLLGVRAMRSGAYLSDAEMRAVARFYGAPAIRAFGADVGALGEFIAHARRLEGAEGYVIRFASGACVKVKADGYVLRHRALSETASEKFVLRAVIEGAADDLAPLLAPEIVEALAAYSARVRAGLSARAREIASFVEEARVRCGGERKGFAAEVNSALAAPLRPAAFKAWEGGDPAETLRAQVLKATHTQERIEAVRELIGGARWSLSFTPEP